MSKRHHTNLCKTRLNYEVRNVFLRRRIGIYDDSPSDVTKPGRTAVSVDASVNSSGDKLPGIVERRRILSLRPSSNDAHLDTDGAALARMDTGESGHRGEIRDNIEVNTETCNIRDSVVV